MFLNIDHKINVFYEKYFYGRKYLKITILKICKNIFNTLTKMK